MLTNKKVGIRVFALVLAMLMTVAVFAGCTDDTARDDAAKAQSSADAAQKTANDAANAASGISSQIDGLKNDIAAADKKADDAAKAADAAANAAADAKKTAIDYHTGDNKPINEKNYTDATTKIEKDLLPELNKLVADYQQAKESWYTAENYAKLTALIKGVDFSLARSLSVSGLENYITTLKNDLAAVPSIVSDAKAVQDKIAAIGDVYANVFVDENGTNTAVAEARAAFTAWAEKYNNFFIANYYTTYEGAQVVDGKVVIKGNEKALVDFAKKICGSALAIDIGDADSLTGLLAAERRVDALKKSADAGMKEQLVLLLEAALAQKSGYNGFGTTAKQLVNIMYKEGTSYTLNNKTEIATVAEAEKFITDALTLIDTYGLSNVRIRELGETIEDCYTTYRLFYNANNGDMSPMKYSNLYDAEQFIKMFVLRLYDYELSVYETAIIGKLNDLVDFFMKSGVGELGNFATSFQGFNNYKVSDEKPTIGTLSGAYDIVIGDATLKVVDNATENTILNISYDGLGFKDTLNQIVVKYYGELAGVTFSKAFKGNTTIEGACKELDQSFLKAFCEMTAAYYADVLTPVVGEFVELEKLYYKNEYVDLPTAVSGTTVTTQAKDYEKFNKAYFKDQDAKFYAEVSALLDKMYADFAAVKIATYDELNTYTVKSDLYKNINTQNIFTIKAGDEAVTASKLYKDNITIVYADAENNNAFKTILDSYKGKVQNAFKAYFALDNLKEENRAIYEYQKDASASLRKIAMVEYSAVGTLATAYTTDYLVKATKKEIKTIAMPSENDWTKLLAEFKSGTTKKVKAEYLADDTATLFANVKQTILDSGILEEQLGKQAKYADAQKVVATYIVTNLLTPLTNAALAAEKAILAVDYADLAAGTCNYTAVLNDKKDVTTPRYQLAIADIDQIIYNALIGVDCKGIVTCYADFSRTGIEKVITTACDGFLKNYSFKKLDETSAGGVSLYDDVEAMLSFIDVFKSLYDIKAAEDFTAKYGYDVYSLIAEKNYVSKNIGKCANLSRTYDDDKYANLTKLTKIDDKNYILETTTVDDLDVMSSELYMHYIADVDTYMSDRTFQKATVKKSDTETYTFKHNILFGGKADERTANGVLGYMLTKAAADFNFYLTLEDSKTTTNLLNAAKEVRYLKDDILNTNKDNINLNDKNYDSLNNIYNAYAGFEYINPVNGTKQVASLFTLDGDELRLEVFQKRLAYAKDRVTDQLNALNLLDKKAELVKYGAKLALDYVRGQMAEILENAMGDDVYTAITDNGISLKEFMEGYGYNEAAKYNKDYVSNEKIEAVKAALALAAANVNNAFTYEASKDDYNFEVAYGRFLAKNGNYEWHKYDGKLNEDNLD